MDHQTANLPVPVDDDACIASFAKDQTNIPISDAVKGQQVCEARFGVVCVGFVCVLNGVACVCY